MRSPLLNRPAHFENVNAAWVSLSRHGQVGTVRNTSSKEGERFAGRIDDVRRMPVGTPTMLCLHRALSPSDTRRFFSCRSMTTSAVDLEKLTDKIVWISLLPGELLFGCSTARTENGTVPFACKHTQGLVRVWFSTDKVTLTLSFLLVQEPTPMAGKQIPDDDWLRSGSVWCCVHDLPTSRLSSLTRTWTFGPSCGDLVRKVVRNGLDVAGRALCTVTPRSRYRAKARLGPSLSKARLADLLWPRGSVCAMNVHTHVHVQSKAAVARIMTGFSGLPRHFPVSCPASVACAQEVEPSFASNFAFWLSAAVKNCYAGL